MTYPDDFLNKVIQGDCLEVMKQMPDKCVDLVVTDPPYMNAGMDYDVFDDSTGVNELVLQFVKEANRISKITLFTAGKFDTEVMLYQQYPPRWRLCWHKGASSNISPVGFNDWEAVLVYGDKVCVNQHDYFRCRNDEKMGNYGHPCPKPIGYALWLISRFSKEGDTILDPFLGSGTTAVAAKQLGRNFIGIELSEKYCEIANQRLRQDILL